jgi:hypothetical protein
MRRSTQVSAPLVAAAALSLLTGCRRPEMQRCVDENNKVVDDSLCANQPQQGVQQQHPDGHGGFVPIILPYYYGGWGGYALGGLAGGGSYTPSASRSYVTRSGVTTRGGFGSSFSGSSHGGGAGE